MSEMPIWFKALFLFIVVCLAYGFACVVRVGWYYLGMMLMLDEEHEQSIDD